VRMPMRFFAMIALLFRNLVSHREEFLRIAPISTSLSDEAESLASKWYGSSLLAAIINHVTGRRNSAAARRF
jgi:hypothetical protein